jgi:NADP-dependent 3-hydroxy acid dehydrogenase YdfG
MPLRTPPVAVITGASSGIGRATALAFAEQGACVVLIARRADSLERLASECASFGAEVEVAAIDVTDGQAVAETAQRVMARFGRMDVWVNNAAVNLYGRVEEAPVDLWRRVVETNVVGTYHGVRAAVPWFREQGAGVLINVSSILSKQGSPYQSAYAASKHAVRAISDCVRQEVLDVPGIAVCTILPGPVDTPIFASAANVTGWRVEAPGTPADARRVAAAIVRCAHRPQREVVVGLSTRLGLLATRLAPGIVEQVMARVLPREHFADVPAAPTAGNLFEPPPEARIDGGWRTSPVQRTAGALVAAATAGTTVAVVRRWSS